MSSDPMWGAFISLVTILCVYSSVTKRRLSIGDCYAFGLTVVAFCILAAYFYMT